MALKLVTPPSQEPITVADARAYLRVDHTDEDATISRLILAARQYVETAAGLALINQTWEWWMDSWPVVRSQARGQDQWWDGVREGPVSLLHPTAPYIEIPKGPVQSVTSVDTFGPTGVMTTWDAENYTLDAISLPGRIFPVTCGGYPTSGLRAQHAIRMVFVAGFGSTGAAVPADIVQLLLMLIAHWYEHREAVLTGTISKEAEFGASQILSRYRKVRV
jgi:hypothetical protein